MSDQPSGQPQPAPAGDVLANVKAFLAQLSPRQKMIGGAIVAAVVLLFLFAGVSGGREITINGYRLGEQELAQLDAIAGTRVPDGHYWLNPQTMAWGVVGSPQPMGVIGYGGYGGQGGAPQWGQVGQNYRGPFGDYMSDGNCSFVNGVAVGNC
jgi:hypothetical protein